MPKTNHNRNFRAKSLTDSRIKAPSTRLRSSLSGINSKYTGNDFTNGKHGAAKAIKGAKKFVVSRTRQWLKTQLTKEIRETGNAQRS